MSAIQSFISVPSMPNSAPSVLNLFIFLSAPGGEFFSVRVK
jgi:hypothetical protein